MEDLASTNLLVMTHLKLFKVVIPPDHVDLELLLISNGISEPMAFLVPCISFVGSTELQYHFILLSLQLE